MLAHNTLGFARQFHHAIKVFWHQLEAAVCFGEFNGLGFGFFALATFFVYQLVVLIVLALK